MQSWSNICSSTPSSVRYSIRKKLSKQCHNTIQEKDITEKDITIFIEGYNISGGFLGNIAWHLFSMKFKKCCKIKINVQQIDNYFRFVAWTPCYPQLTLLVLIWLWFLQGFMGTTLKKQRRKKFRKFPECKAHLEFVVLSYPEIIALCMWCIGNTG